MLTVEACLIALLVRSVYIRYFVTDSFIWSLINVRQKYNTNVKVVYYY